MYLHMYTCTHMYICNVISHNFNSIRVIFARKQPENNGNIFEEPVLMSIVDLFRIICCSAHAQRRDYYYSLLPVKYYNGLYTGHTTDQLII